MLTLLLAGGVGVSAQPAAPQPATGSLSIDRFQPARADAVTLVYDASPGRPVRLTVVPGASAQTPTTFDLGVTASELEPLVAELREIILLRPEASLGRIVRLGDELGDQLLAPAADHLRDASRLLLSTNGPLSELPFAALRAPRSIDVQGRYVVETRGLCWINPALPPARSPSADQHGGQTPVALSVADAVYRPPARPLGASMSDGGISWREHAARRNQAGTVAGLGHPVVSRFGQDANPALLWLSTADYAVRVLHLAVEATVDAGDPSASALLLSGTRHDAPARRATASELATKLKLEVDPLVVLSGLDTGGHGLGPAPFVEAFGAAGASSVVASLWPVVDESATHLFEAFYTRLAAEGESLAVALREAQLKLLREPLSFDQGAGREPVEFDASHPYYWAGYQLHRGSGEACSSEIAYLTP